MRHVADFAVQAVGKVLNDRKRPLKERFRALFTLRNLGGSCAIECISKCFDDPSALLKHELAYCLGQMKDTSAIPTLISVLKDVNQEPIVRHEAAEALGAIGMPLGVLEEFTADKESVVAETCQLALKRIAWLESPESKEAKFQDSPYSSIDPAPPLLEDRPIQELKIMLLDSTKSLFERYRAMFTLRDSGSTDAVLALSQGLKCPSSALFRHEVAFVLGQIQEDAATPYLKQVLADSSELGMVRHECAEALGAIASQECMDILKQFENDPEALVRESCEVALDMCEYENSDELQYANTLLQVQPEALI